jgi:hypothetical protein
MKAHPKALRVSKTVGETTRSATRPTFPQNTRIVGFPRFNTLNAFPAMAERKMNFSSRVTLTSTSADLVGAQLAWQLNSLYEPEVAVAHQPYGFDQLCGATGPYTRYKVRGVKVKITATNTSTSTAPIFLVSQLLNVVDTSVIAGVDIASCSERPNVRTDMIPAFGNQTKIFHVNIPSLHPLFNWDKQTFDIDMGQTTGPYNNNPGSLPTLNLGVANHTGDASAYLLLEFEFDVIFYDRLTLPGS